MKERDREERGDEKMKRQRESAQMALFPSVLHSVGVLSKDSAEGGYELRIEPGSQASRKRIITPGSASRRKPAHAFTSLTDVPYNPHPGLGTTIYLIET